MKNIKMRILINNIYKSKLLLFFVLCSTAVLFVGCQNKNTNSNTENKQTIDSQKIEDNSKDRMTPEDSNISEVPPSVEESSSEESTLLFSELSKYQFVFSSGAGAWQTMLNINEDGTFNGYYSDSDMGDIGEDHPNGVNYSSTFEGKFTTPKKVNDYTYSISIESMKLEKEAGTEEIIDGIKYIYTEPYGLDGAKEIYIYTPQAPIKELPEGFRSWVGYMDLSDLKDEYLPFYGLYNVETESGFSSYEIDQTEED
ncbi:hypothetical protein [Defluviitalea saccharophila]|uniref:Lipoprotein n=1 Tax=Defluviitalea saccharophila TaxID=879970 RepID=A0ABZ2Y4N1_9FIRM